MGAFSELDMERDNFYSPEDAPAGFSMEDDPISFAAQAPTQQQTITAVQPAADEDTPKMSADTTGTSSGENSGAGSNTESGKKADDTVDEDAKRKAHEEAEAKRKAEFDAKQAAKKAAEQEQLAKVAAMSDEEVLAASMQRVSTDTEKLTRRNMMECVREHIQTLCLDDPGFARKVMQPQKNMIRCYQYINRKAWEFAQDDLKARGLTPGRDLPSYCCAMPEGICYQWAVDYFNDPDAKEDHVDEEKFVPKPYIGRTTKGKATPKAKDKGKGQKDKAKKPAEQPKAEPKPKDDEGQMSLLGMA